MQTSLHTQPFMHLQTTCRALQRIALTLVGLLVVACSAPATMPVPPVPTDEPQPTALVSEVSAETLPDLVIAEREASIAGNLPLLTLLWAQDGRIVDGRGSAQTSDDYVWRGRAAILDRYTLAVFPAPPPPLTASELTGAVLTVNGDQATLINGGDQWRFVRHDGRWWLQELIYNAP